MSFSIATTATIGTDDPGHVIDAAVRTAIDSASANHYEANVALAQSLGMIDAAKAYVAALAPKIARDGDVLSISLSGHANESAEPKPGWSANTITVSLSQAYGAEHGS